MAVTLDEMKNYLRIDQDEDDALIEKLISGSEKLCKDILRNEEPDEDSIYRTAVLYAVSYLYEHREEADHTALMRTLRDLLSTGRKAVF